MVPDSIIVALNDILYRELPGGGFRDAQAGSFSPEASAWAVLALKASGENTDAMARACSQLASNQHPDGSVCAVAGCDEATWPTPLCILAWKSVSGYSQPADSAVDFLLSVKGRHTAKPHDSPAGHDTSLVAWPWINGTHSWIEPTSLSIIALASVGYKEHPRTTEAVRMIKDRQLSGGGWNYGNTIVFGRELLPTPENTGQALCALNGMAGRASVDKSLRYLEDCALKVRTPMALSWILEGLATWSLLPQTWESMVIESLKLQHRYGPYSTVLLSQLLSVFFTSGKRFQIRV
jgi:hypothetical protein